MEYLHRLTMRSVVIKPSSVGNEPTRSFPSVSLKQVSVLRTAEPKSNIVACHRSNYMHIIAIVFTVDATAIGVLTFASCDILRLRVANGR